MKKFFRILAATMLLAVMATTLCSCGVPSDATKAKANLEKTGTPSLCFRDLIRVILFR